MSILFKFKLQTVLTVRSAWNLWITEHYLEPRIWAVVSILACSVPHSNTSLACGTACTPATPQSPGGHYRERIERREELEKGFDERVASYLCEGFMTVWANSIHSFMQLCNVLPTSNKREMTLKYTRVITMFVWWRVSKHNCYCSHSYRLILQYRQLCMLQSYEKR